MKVGEGTGENVNGEPLPAKQELGSTISNALFSLINEIPESDATKSRDPLASAREILSKASLRAAAISGVLALPPGPAGWLTILPDLVAVWRVQRQMVSDIASVYDKRSQLTSDVILPLSTRCSPSSSRFSYENRRETLGSSAYIESYSDNSTKGWGQNYPKDRWCWDCQIVTNYWGVRSRGIRLL